MDDIIVGNNNYYNKLDKDIVKIYREDRLIKELDIPVAICIYDKKEVRLIDGYHRIAAAKEDGMEVVNIILGTKENEDQEVHKSEDKEVG